MNARIREQSSGRNPLFLKNLAVFSFLIAFFLPLAAHAQTYYYTGKNPMTPGAEDAASAIPCDDQAIGVIRYNTSTAAFEGCNGVAWADIRNGGAAGAAGLTGQVQFNSGGVLGASANFTWNNATGTLTAGNHDTNAASGTYKLGGTTVMTYPNAGADTTSFAVGPGALTGETGTGSDNVAVGPGAIQYISSGFRNTALGYQAMQGSSGAPITGGENTAVGNTAMFSLQGGAIDNTAVGSRSLDFLTTGSYNTAVGELALYGNATGSHNTAVGALAIENTSSGPNSALGFEAGLHMSSGTANTAIGYEAMLGTTAPFGALLTGSDNTALGDSALYQLSGAAANNTGLGYHAGKAVYTGTDNTLLGYQAGLSVTGNYNIVVGEGGNITSGSSNILLGNSLTGTAATSSNQLDIGDLINGDLTGKMVGINQAAPANSLTLSVNGNVGATNYCDTSNANCFTAASIASGGAGAAGSDRQVQFNSGGKLGASAGLVFTSAGKLGMGTTTPGTALDVNGAVTMEPTSVTLTANNTVLATANRSYFQVTSDDITETNRVFCFGAGTLGQILIVEWTSATNRGEIVSHGNCGSAVGAVTASLSFTNWAPKNAETILQLMYNGTHWIQIAGSANY